MVSKAATCALMTAFDDAVEHEHDRREKKRERPVSAYQSPRFPAPRRAGGAERREFRIAWPTSMRVLPAALALVAFGALDLDRHAAVIPFSNCNLRDDEERGQIVERIRSSSG